VGQILSKLMLACLADERGVGTPFIYWRHKMLDVRQFSPLNLDIDSDSSKVFFLSRSVTCNDLLAIKCFLSVLRHDDPINF